MTVRVTEKPKQAGTTQFRAPKARNEYTISGTLVRLEAQIALASAAPASVPGCDTDGTEIDIFLNKLDLQEIGGGVWHGSADYSNTPDQFELTFNVGTQTIKRQQALEHIRTYDCLVGGEATPGSGIPDFQGAIGVHGGDNGGAFSAVDGVDVEVGKTEFTLTKKLNFTSLTSTHFWTVANMTPSVNDDDFIFNFKGQTFIFPKGSALFRGAPMKANSDNQVEISYMFAYSRNTGLEAPEWDIGTTYGAGDRVVFNFMVWESLAGGNVGNEPVVDTWLPDLTYAFGDKVRFVGILGDGHVYESLAGGNQGNRPDANPGDWQDDGNSPWTYVGPSVGELRIGNSGPIIKEGWWYLWVWYAMQVTSGVAIPIPRAVVIDRVLDYGNFDLLDL